MASYTSDNWIFNFLHFLQGVWVINTGLSQWCACQCFCVWRAAEQERGELEVHFFSFTTASKTEAELRLLALFFVYFYRGLDIILRSLVLLSEVTFFLTGGVLKCVMHLQLLGMSEERGFIRSESGGIRMGKVSGLSKSRKAFSPDAELEVWRTSPFICCS